MRDDTGGAQSSAPRFVLRDAGPLDLVDVLALNNSAVPNVNEITPAVLERIVGLASWFRVAEDAEGITGFVICMGHEADYWSGNFHWFRERYDAFLYLDRVVVAERVRGQGIGAMLYADMHRFAATRWPRVALEVNLAPPNPGSVRFHERLGYERVGVRDYGDNSVAMYLRAMKAQG